MSPYYASKLFSVCDISGDINAWEPDIKISSLSLTPSICVWRKKGSSSTDEVLTFSRMICMSEVWVFSRKKNDTHCDNTKAG